MGNDLIDQEPSELTIKDLKTALVEFLKQIPQINTENFVEDFFDEDIPSIQSLKQPAHNASADPNETVLNKTTQILYYLLTEDYDTLDSMDVSGTSNIKNFLSRINSKIKPVQIFYRSPFMNDAGKKGRMYYTHRLVVVITGVET